MPDGTASRFGRPSVLTPGPGDAGLPGALADLYARNQRMLGDVDRERRRLLRESALVTKAQAAVAAYADTRETRS